MSATEPEPPVERTSDAARSGVGGFYLDLGRLIRSLPPDVNKKLSLHDLKRVCDNYNTIPCPNCYGGHFRPCQWCGDTGRVVFIPGGAERWANGDAGESESGAGSQNVPSSPTREEKP
jgi:hypothetical protein